ncbi:MAG: outer membrane beta-barrel protein [Deltaproteobacteria bacterium]|nr:outer membrane beta-barrel protein [Deltaproteobacteria bacterium]
MKQTNKTTPLRFLSLLLVAIFSFSSIAHGRESMPKTKFDMDTGLAYKLEHNDNIFLGKRKDNDFISTISPSLHLEYNNINRQLSATAGYSLDIVSYKDYHENNYTVNTPYLSIHYRTPFNLYGDFDNTYIHTADPYGTLEHYGEGRKTRRSSNKANFKIGYDISGRLAIEGLYNNQYRWFDDEIDKWKNRERNIFGLQLINRLTPKTSFILKYTEESNNYIKQNKGVDGWNSKTSQDNIKKDYLTGFSVDPRGKINGLLTLGYETIKFENKVNKNSNPYSDMGTWTAEIDIHYQIKTKTELSLILDRKIRPTDISGTLSYTDTSLRIGYDQALMRSFLISFDTGIAIWDYDMDDGPALPEQKYNLFHASMEIDYSIKKWLSALIRYEYKTREATKAAYNKRDYTNNIISLSIASTF